MIISVFIFKNDSLNAAKSFIENRLNVKLSYRDSSFRGGTYCRGKSDEFPEILIEINFDDEDDEVIIGGYSTDNYTITMYHDDKPVREILECDEVELISEK